jgi:DNA-binding MarR family transcriptional regulator
MNVNTNYLKAIHQIIRTGHWITDRVGQDLKEYGITEPQFNVLRILQGRRGTPIAVQEIQEQMVQRTSNVTRIVDKLLEKGLVERKECPLNRRKMDITITEKGTQELAKMGKKVYRFHGPLAQNLSEKEARELTNLISKLKGETNHEKYSGVSSK